jgi:hypothetical protein
VGKPLADELEACKARIRELEEVTEILRESAQAFGALADRLNARLQETRRRESESADEQTDRSAG